LTTAVRISKVAWKWRQRGVLEIFHLYYNVVDGVVKGMGNRAGRHVIRRTAWRVAVAVTALLAVFTTAGGPVSGAPLAVPTPPSRDLLIITPWDIQGTGIPPAASTLKVHTETPPTNITSSSARLSFHLIQMGSSGSANVSFQWGTSANASTAGETSPQQRNSTGFYYSDLGSLSAGTTYYFRAKAVDSALAGEIEYGDWESFTTLAGPPPPPDTTPPAAVTNLTAGSPTQTTITLTWTAPGDDGTTGTAGTYDIRYATAAIDEGNWETATQATGEPTPGVAGTNETFMVTGLSANTTYYFALKTGDEIPNLSPVSNIPSATTLAVPPPPPDTTPPAAVTNLAAGSPTQTTVTLTWTAPGDDGAIGTATAYDIRYATAAIDEGNWGTATQAAGEPAPGVAGSSEAFMVTGLAAGTTYFFALKTADEVPNRSPISNSPNAATLSTTPPVPPPAGGGGSAGGGGGPPSGPGATSLTAYTNDAGVFNLAAAASSEDNKVQLAFAKGVQARTREGSPLKVASITGLVDPPPPPVNARSVGLAYELGPDGATFAPPIALTFVFDPALLPPGFPARDVVIATWDAAGKRWVPLDGITVDTTRNAVSAMVSHFSQYTVLAIARPAAFSVSNLSLSRPEIKPGESLSVAAQVTNRGDVAGSYAATLRVNGAAEPGQSLEVPANANRTVTFTITGGTPGTYAVELNGLSAQFTVSSPPRPAAFSVNSLTVSPPEVKPGEDATISLIVSNTGESAGSYTLTVMVDGSERESRQVTLSPHTSQNVVLSAAHLTPGVHTVTVGSESGVFVVTALAAVSERLVNWYLVAILVFVITAIASSVGFRLNGRRAYLPPGSSPAE
jgi:archaellum component FlaG (FlaF/FlaG flagellin family)